MPVGAIRRAFAYEVSPKQDTPFVGGVVRVSPELQAALDATYDRSRVDSAPAVTLHVEASDAKRSHPVRDVAVGIAFRDAPADIVEPLAARLASILDYRSKPSLLMVTVHDGSHPDSRRVVIWMLPQQQVFNLRSRYGTNRLEVLEGFNRESTLRKIAVIEGADNLQSMLTARVLDLQASAVERAIADFWVEKFLDARLQMSDKEGTRNIARALRQVFSECKGDHDALEQVSTTISLLRRAPGARTSATEIANSYLSEPVGTMFLAGLRPEECQAAFRIDVPTLEDAVQFRRFVLASQVVVSAPFSEVGADGAVTIEDVAGSLVLHAHGEVVEQQVRTRA